MSMAARTAAVGTHMPTEEMRSAARKLSELLALGVDQATVVRLKVDDIEERISITPDMAKLLQEIMDYVKEGRAVTLVPVNNFMTTQQAADVLNVSRPYLVKLLETGVLPHTKLGRHRRILAEDLFAYKSRRDEIRSRALSELIKSDADLY